MIVLIDNYDSFSYNLYQLIGQLNPDIKVIRNDDMTVENLEGLHPDHLIIRRGRVGRRMPGFVNRPSAILRERSLSSASAWAIRPFVKSTAAPLPTPEN